MVWRSPSNNRGRAPLVLDAVLSAPAEHGVPTLAEIEGATVERALRVHEGNKNAAARSLGIDRRTLYRLMARSLAAQKGD